MVWFRVWSSAAVLAVKRIEKRWPEPSCRWSVDHGFVYSPSASMMVRLVWFSMPRVTSEMAVLLMKRMR